MNKTKIMKNSGRVLPGWLSLAGCESVRPKTPLTQGAAESVRLHEKGSSVLPSNIQATSPDNAYGFTANNPVRVGGRREAGGPNPQRYRNGLPGPRKQPPGYEHEGSCCAAKIAEQSFDNDGQLDA
jgi:hypothetical protein